MTAGILYGIGVGPGDPELMTIKAVRKIQEIDVIVVPGEQVETSMAYKIAIQMVPEIKEKQLVAIPMPMTKDQNVIENAHKEGAKQLAKYLEKGKNVAFLTLGDVSIYSTFSYVQEYIVEKGFTCELISGIPSFCAAAAQANIPLTLWAETLAVIPSVHYDMQKQIPREGTVVMMKAGNKLKDIKQYAKDHNKHIIMVENCGTNQERIYEGIEEIPDKSGYLTLVIMK